jgi:hypothetical protein
LDRIDQKARPLDGTYSYGTTGSGVTVYVVDSGVRMTHSEFGGRATSGYDFVDSDTDASDCAGHGTHVAGTVGGAKYGVAKSVRLVSLRVFGCGGSGLWSDTIAAFDWVVTNHSGPAVVNYSGGGSSYQLVDDAVTRMTAAGVPVVVAAGNNDVDACTFSPAETPSAITVAATDSGDVRAGFSDYGPCVDLFAPGVNVLSSLMDSDTSSGYMSGTSMATPHVTGAVARYLQSNPSATVSQVTAAVLSAATQGVVADAQSANSGLLYVAPPTIPAAPSSVRATAGNASASISWTAPSNDGGSPITGYRVVASPGGQQVTTSGTSRTATVSGLTNGTTYSFTVTAINAVGAGPASSASNAVTPVAPAPSQVPDGATAVTGKQASSSSATVTWSPPTNPGSAIISGYRLSRDGTDSAGAGPYATTLSSASRTFTFTKLVSGRTYNLTVQPVSAAGTGRAVTMAVPISATSVLNAPSSTSAGQTGSGVATVQWAAPTVTAGKTITGYKVARDGVDSAGVGAYATTVAATTRSFSMTKLVTGSTYTLSVQAVTSTGAGPLTKATVKVLPYVSAPTSTAVTQSAAGAARITWQPPTTTSGQTITGYRVSRDGTDTAGAGPYATVVSASTRSFTMTRLQVSSRYALSVQALTSSTVSPPASGSVTISY